MENITKYLEENTIGFWLDVALILVFFILIMISLMKKFKKKVVIFIPIVYLLIIVLYIVFDLKYIALTTILATVIFSFSITYVSSSELKQHQRNVIDKKITPKYLSNEDEKQNLIKVLLETVLYFSERKIGAIITIEQENNLNTYIDKGVKLDANVTTELLRTIFFPNTALHDGAVIIRGNRIVSAAVFYTPSDKADIPSELGSRHRAAIGISEDSDAYTLVVSEETGYISTTIGGTITRNLSKESLELSLNQHIIVK